MGGKGPRTLQFFAFCAVIYAVFLVLTVVFYPISQGLLKPQLAHLLPVYQDATLSKTVISLTIVYWVMVVFYWAWAQNRQT